MVRLDLQTHGAALYPDAARDVIAAIEALVAKLPEDQAGIRLRNHGDLADLLSAEAIIGGLAAQHIGDQARPVRAILFDKSPGANWALGWHQDRTIAVQARREVEGFGPWTTKAGIQHVEPPFAIIERMVTLHIHLDPAPEDNAPLLIAPGSHRLGRIPETLIQAVVAQCGRVSCLAERGDIWIYATPILHASAAAVSPRRRRVLQVDYSADALPGGLLWAGI